MPGVTPWGLTAVWLDCEYFTNSTRYQKIVSSRRRQHGVPGVDRHYRRSVLEVRGHRPHSAALLTSRMHVLFAGVSSPRAGSPWVLPALPSGQSRIPAKWRGAILIAAPRPLPDFRRARRLVPLAAASCNQAEPRMPYRPSLAAHAAIQAHLTRLLQTGRFELRLWAFPRAEPAKHQAVASGAHTPARLSPAAVF